MAVAKKTTSRPRAAAPATARAAPPQPPMATLVAPPAAPAPPGDPNLWPMLCHLTAVVAGFLGPLIVWLIKRKEQAEVDRHGKAALNFQLSMMLYSLILTMIVVLGSAFGFLAGMADPAKGILAGILLSFILFIPFLGLAILNIVSVVLASMKASRGELHRYVLSIPFLR